MRTGWQRPGRVRVVTGATGRTYARTEARTMDEGIQEKDIGKDCGKYGVGDEGKGRGRTEARMAWTV